MTSKQTNTFREEIEKMFPHSKECIKGRRDLENNFKMTIDCIEPERQEKIKAILALFQKVVDKAVGSYSPEINDAIADKRTMINLVKAQIRSSFKDIISGKIKI